MEKTFSEIIEALSQPQAYTHSTGPIKVMHTQMSCVFLTGDYAYKIKKPVNLGYLDYSTLEKRLHFCQKEVKLNRRLARSVYLGVVPIAEKDGVIKAGEQGEPLEYAVRMKQLPQERMLNVLLAQGAVTRDMIKRLAEKIASFHNRAKTNKRIAGYGRPKAIEKNVQENFSQTAKYTGKAISAELYNDLRSFSEDFMRDRAQLFQKRIDNSRIRDCHGDLHSAHICFGKSIYIYDCIEFNERFRYGDVASEVAFLAMDLDYHGRRDLSRLFVSTYQEYSEDFEVRELLNFYKLYRAYVRGKVNCFKSDDQFISGDEREASLKTARSYFRLAWSYVCPEIKPMLFIMVGLVGTGKSALASALAEKIGAMVFSSDLIRKEIAGISPAEHRFEDFQKGIYKEEFTKKTYDALFNKARKILRLGKNVVLDASFLYKSDRDRALELARECDVPLTILECRAPESVIKERIEKRLQEGTASDGRWEIFQRQKTYFEAIEEEPGVLHLIINTTIPVPELVEQILSRIEQT